MIILRQWYDAWHPISMDLYYYRASVWYLHACDENDKKNIQSLEWFLLFVIKSKDTKSWCWFCLFIGWIWSTCIRWWWSTGRISLDTHCWRVRKCSFDSTHICLRYRYHLFLFDNNASEFSMEEESSSSRNHSNVSRRREPIKWHEEADVDLRQVLFFNAFN